MSTHSSLYRSFALILIVLIALTTAPISAAEFGSPGAAAVGSVTIAGSVQLRGIVVAREGTVFSGDRIVVRADSSASLALSGGQTIALTSNTDLTVESDGSIARLALASGMVSFSTSGRSSLQIDVAPYEVVSDTASAQVFVLSDKTLGVRVRSGSLMVRNTDSNESFLLTEGQEKLLDRANGAVADPISMIASNLPGPLPAGLPPAPQASGMSSGAWAGVIAAVAGGAAAASWFLAGRDKVDQSALDAANTARDAANAALAAANSNLTAANAALAVANTARDAATAALATANSDLDAANAALAVANSDLAAANTAVAVANTAVAAANTALAVANTALAAANSEIVLLDATIASICSVTSPTLPHADCP